MIELLLGLMIGLLNAILILVILRPESTDAIKESVKEKLKGKEKGEIIVFDPEEERRIELFQQADKEQRDLSLKELLKDDYDD